MALLASTQFMNWSSGVNAFLEAISPSFIECWDATLNYWFFIGALIFLLMEFLRYAFIGRLNLGLMSDMLTNFTTLVVFLGINFLLLSGLYVAAVYSSYSLALFDIEINLLTVFICIVLADLLYYWEHRCMHRFNFAWATHSVHHSSPHFNISVAYRFGPMDGLWPMLGTIIMVLLGFHPILVAFAEIFVQLYQTILHTEAIKKLPRPIEYIFNTPSHHRVHHGSNPEYLDANYGGIFIVWDRMFATFAEEGAAVEYGLVKPINSNNPLVAFFHGFFRVGQKVVNAKGWRNKVGYFCGPPEFLPSSTPAEVSGKNSD